MRIADFQNGIGRSQYDQNGFASLIGCDIASKPGVVKSSFAMALDSGSTVTEYCKFVVVDPDGNSYWFSNTSGKIWKRTSGGVWSLARTNTQGACVGACYYNGYVYYASEDYLGRHDADGVGWWDTWQTFGVGSGDHPMIEQNLTLFIGDAMNIASVNSSDTFTANALDLPSQQRVKCLFPYESDLIIGTKIGEATHSSGVFRWDTYSDSWVVEDYVGENGVNMFINGDNEVFSLVGSNHNLYSYDGVDLIFERQLLDDDAAMSGSGSLGHGTTNNNGDPLIATKRGIYSYKSILGIRALVIEYINSTGQEVTPAAISSCGTELLSAWKNGSAFGVDKLSTTTRGNGKIITPIAIGKYKNVLVKYAALPSGTSISIETKVDGGSWTAQTVVTDSVNKICYFNGGLGDVNNLQARITMTSSGSSTPEIEYIEFI